MPIKRKSKLYSVKNGKNGMEMKNINASSLSSSDLERWFGSATSARTAVELVSRVSTLYRCVELRASSLGGMPRQITDADGTIIATANWPSPPKDDDGKDITEDNLPFKIDLTDLLWRTEASMMLMSPSEAYWLILRNRIQPTAVRWLNPTTIDPIYSRKDGVVGFERIMSKESAPDQTYYSAQREDVDVLRLDEVAYFWRPSLRELGPGISPAPAASRPANLKDYWLTFLETYFREGAMPATVFKADSYPDEEERNRIKSYIERLLTGVGNAFGVEVLSTGMEFEQLIPPLKDMMVPEISDNAQREIAITYGIPLSIVFSDAANFAVSEIDNLNFYDKTLVPESLLVAKSANKTFFEPHLGWQLRFRPDLLEIFQQRELDKVQVSLELYDRGIIDESEVRVAAGYMPRTEGNLPDDDDPVIDPNEDEHKEIEESIDETLDDLDPVKTLEKYLKTIARRQASALNEKVKERNLWKRKVVKRLGKENPYEVVFEAKHLTPSEVAHIRESLLAAVSNEEVKAAFAASFRPVVH